MHVVLAHLLIRYKLWIISIFAKNPTDSKGPKPLKSIDGYLCPDCPSLRTPTSCCSHLLPPDPPNIHTWALRKTPKAMLPALTRQVRTKAPGIRQSVG